MPVIGASITPVAVASPEKYVCVRRYSVRPLMKKWFRKSPAGELSRAVCATVSAASGALCGIASFSRLSQAAPMFRSGCFPPADLLRGGRQGARSRQKEKRGEPVHPLPRNHSETIRHSFPSPTLSLFHRTISSAPATGFGCLPAQSATDRRRCATASPAHTIAARSSPGCFAPSLRRPAPTPSAPSSCWPCPP